MKEEGGVTPVPQAAQPEVQLRPLGPQALTSRPACLPFNGGHLPPQEQSILSQPLTNKWLWKEETNELKNAG